MAHALPGLVADAETNQLVVRPQRAVEEYQRRAAHALLQLRRHASNGNLRAALRAAGADLDPHGILCHPGEVLRLAPFEEQRHLSRHRESGHGQAQRTVAADQLDALAQIEGPALDIFRIERAEDRVLRQQAENAPCAPQHEGLAFPHRQQAGDVIDLGAGQHDRAHRRIAQAFARPKALVLQQLLTCVGRCVEHDPALAIGAHGDRSLCTPLGARGPFPSALAGRRIAIPLRKASAGRRTEHHHFHGC